MASVKRKARGAAEDKAIDGARRSMFTGMGFFVQFQPYAKDLQQEAAELEKSAIQLGNILTKYLELDEPLKLLPVPEAVKEETIQDTAARVKSRAFDLAKLGLIIPLLLNKDAREYMASFLSGLTGISTDAFKNALIGIGVVLAGVFTYKLFKQVSDTFTAFKQLSDATATLFNLTSDAAGELDAEKEKVDKDKKKIEKEKEKKAKEKKALDEKKANAKSAKDELKKEKRALKGKNKLSKLFAFATRIAPNVGKKLLSAIPFVGTFAAIGFLLYEIYDEAINFFDDEEREPPKVEAVKEEEEDDEEKESSRSVQAEPVAKAPIADSVPPIVKQAAQTQPQTQEQSSAEPEVTNQQEMSSPATTSAPSQEALSVNNKEEGSAQQEVNDASLEVPVFTMPKTLEFAESSEEITLEKKDVMPMVIVNNIDNSSTFTNVEAPESSTDSNYRYSTTVGT